MTLMGVAREGRFHKLILLELLAKSISMSGSNKEELKNPPVPVKSALLDLFGNFLSNDLANVSNSIEYWEQIPKYFFTPAQQKKLRTSDGLASVYNHEYRVKNKQGHYFPYTVEIQPALIKQSDGSYMAFFPSKAEEQVEEVLKKIFSDQQHGIHAPDILESWVRFSYSMIRKELARMGCSRNYVQIKHSLDVMSGCILRIYEGKKEIYKGAILGNYLLVDREKYLEDSKSTHVAQLPVFISKAVNTLQYRQCNYKRIMGFKAQLSAWVYKKLVNRYTYAGDDNSYHFRYSDLKENSGLLAQSVERDNRKKVISALKELLDTGVLLNDKATYIREGRTIVDVKYEVFAHPDFVAEQKAANKRVSDNHMQALYSGFQLVGN
jgi:hypothetical protein